MSSLNKKSKVNSARITRKNKIESIRKSLNLGTKNKPETFFLRKEMEAICFSITGSIVPTNCQTSVMFKKQLLPYGYYSQKTVDSHPVVANLDLIIKKISTKRKSSGVSPAGHKKYKTRKDKGTKRTSLGVKIFGEDKTVSSDNNVKAKSSVDTVTETKLSFLNIDEELKSVIFNKIKNQDLNSIVIEGNNVSIFFK